MDHGSGMPPKVYGVNTEFPRAHSLHSRRLSRSLISEFYFDRGRASAARPILFLFSDIAAPATTGRQAIASPALLPSATAPGSNECLYCSRRLSRSLISEFYFDRGRAGAARPI